jgi:rubredoxin
MPEHLGGVCGFIYDESQGDPEVQVPPHMELENLPGDWVCPVCSAAPDYFITVA